MRLPCALTLSVACARMLAQQAMAIAERHAAERDAALSSVAEHRAMLGELNGRASSDREMLQADLAVMRSSERDARDKAHLAETQLSAAAEREKQLMDRLAAELTDKAAGAEVWQSDHLHFNCMIRPLPLGFSPSLTAFSLPPGPGRYHRLCPSSRHAARTRRPA